LTEGKSEICESDFLSVYHLERYVIIPWDGS